VAEHDATGAADHVLLIGMMGAGKSTTGSLLAQRLGAAYLDSDAEILRRTGRTVPEIWHQDGEPAFRAEEARVLADALHRHGPTVVGVAGGAVLDPVNRELIRRAGTVVWLRARPETLARRVGAGEGRPLLEGDPAANIARLDAERRPIYTELAGVVVDVDELSPPEVVDRIVSAAGLATGS
jgi:shikimate kinase